MAMLATSSLNCSPRATKSVSQLTSTSTPSLQQSSAGTQMPANLVARCL